MAAKIGIDDNEIGDVHRTAELAAKVGWALAEHA